jgi:glycosyltransferase involved in cell wall biosynthesis
MREKKKVAILLPWLKMGGTNKIALHFMKELSQYCDVTLILSEYTGELLSQLPENIHLVVDTMRPFKEIFKEDLRKLRIGNLIRDAVYYGRIKAKKDNVDNYRYLVQRHGYICDTEFDCAISYHGQSPERLLNLLYRTHAKKKVAWIHGEFSNTADHCRRMNVYYDQLDHMFFVSNHTLNSCLGKFTMDRNKCSVYYNPIDKQEILDKAEHPCTPEFDPAFINLLTVGRVSAEKGQDMIPAVTRKLLDAGHKVRWYVVGDGDTRVKVESLIRENNVNDNVILLGTRTNPYPYMKSCDIYVQPSYTEGYSTTICEAGMLGKAIVGTKPSGGIYDQITDGEDGFIVDATVEGLTEGVRKLIENAALRREFEQNIQKKNFEGKGEIQKFLAFLVE